MTPKTFFFITYYAFFSPYKHLLLKKLSTYLKKYDRILPYQKGGGVEVLQVTYQKRDGCVIQKYRGTMLPYKIGETTSMGWKVLNIEFEYESKYYPEHEYNALLLKNKQNFIKRKQTVELVKKELKTFIYYFLAIIIVSLLRTLIGI